MFDCGNPAGLLCRICLTYGAETVYYVEKCVVNSVNLDRLRPQKLFLITSTLQIKSNNINEATILDVLFVIFPISAYSSS